MYRLQRHGPVGHILIPKLSSDTVTPHATYPPPKIEDEEHHPTNTGQRFGYIQSQQDNPVLVIKPKFPGWGSACTREGRGTCGQKCLRNDRQFRFVSADPQFGSPLREMAAPQ